MIHTVYNPWLVAVSILIASVAGYVALDLAGRVTAASGRSRLAWMAGSATAMGVGIWSMHFVAMLALRTTVRVDYDVVLLLASILIAIGGSAVTFLMSAREQVRTRELALASLFMGPAIAGMHYTGMAAMRMQARIIYDPLLLRLSVVIAVVVSFVALQLAVYLRHRNNPRGQWLKVASACVMGAAVYGMHYTGMVAARFVYDPTAGAATGPTIGGSQSLAAAVAVMTIIVLAIAVIGAIADRHLKATKAEADALRASEERYRLLFETNPLPMWVFDARDFNFLAVNGAAIAHYGYTREEFLGMKLAELHPVAQLPLLERAVKASESGLGSMAGLIHRRKDETLIEVDKTLHPIKLDGRDARLALVNDVTRQRAAEKALSQTMDLLRAVIEDSPVAIIATDPEFRVTRWNPAAEALLGWNAAEITGKSYRHLLPEAELRQHGSLPATALSGQAATNVQTVHIRRDGTQVNVSVSLAVLHDSDGIPNGFVFLVADETTRKRLEAQVSQAQRMEAVGQLAGGVAHDFNNLLTAIMSYSEFLLGGFESGDTRREDVVAIREAANRAASLTKQLLAFSRQQVRNPEMLSLNTAVEDVCEMVRRLLPADIRLVLELDDRLRCVNADPGQIEQVILNLVLNARDAIPSGGEVVVRTSNMSVDTNRPRDGTGDSVAGEYVMLTVSDTGTGMTPEVQARIFEPFFTTKAAGSGTGLGLATVYGIVKQNDGHVWVDSIPGAGTTFRVLLRRADGAQAAVPQLEARAAADGGSETILLVEDNELVRAVASRTLADFGYVVIEAHDGREALERYDGAGRRIDLVVTDLVMPEMGGYELAQALRDRDPGIVVLFISGYSRDAAAKPGFLDDGSDYLAKPFTPEALAARVREMLDGSSIISLAARQTRRAGGSRGTARKGIRAG